MTFCDAFDVHHLHHAYLVEGDPDRTLPLLLDCLRAAGIAGASDAPPEILSFANMRIDHAHELRRKQTFSSTETEKKIFIVIARTMTGEAQNTLLKTLEEPTAHTHFFFLMESRVLLAPTVLSRMFIVADGVDRAEVAGLPGEAFLALSIANRMKHVEKMLRKKDDEEDKERMKKGVRDLLDALECALAKRGITTPDVASALLDVRTAKRYSLERSPSMKLLLEHLALTLPLP